MPSIRITYSQKNELSVRALLNWLIFLVGSGLLLPRLLLFGQLSLTLVAWPWQFDYDEGINLNATLQLAQGHNIYVHNGPSAFLSAPYTPLFNLLNVPLVWVAGPSFVGGRALSLLCTLTIAFLLFYITWKAFGVWALGAVGGMLWLSLSPVIVWAAIYKQDMLALMLGLAGLAWVLAHKQGRHVYLGALLFVLAFYSKQSALSAAVATSLWLILTDRARGLRFTLLVGALTFLPAVLANALLYGGLWEHLVGNNALPWSGARFLRSLQRVWGENWPLLLWSSAGAICTMIGGMDASPQPSRVYRWRLSGTPAIRGPHREVSSFATLVPLYRPQLARIPQDKRAAHRASSNSASTLIALYFLIGGLSTLVQIGSEGANFNHLLDLLLPACLLAPLTAGYLVKLTEITWLTLHIGRLCWRRLLPRPTNPVRVARWPIPATVALIALFLVAQMVSFRDPRTWFYNAWPNSTTDTSMRRVATLVANTPGDIYSEDAYLLLRSKHRVVYDDPSTFVPLSMLGRWDDSSFVQSLCQGRFALIILSRGSRRWTPDERIAFQANYRLKFSDLLDVYERTPETAKVQLPSILKGAKGLRTATTRELGIRTETRARSGVCAASRTNSR